MRISDWSSDVCSSDLAALDADAQPHFGDRAEEIALDVGGERLERRDIEGMEPVRGIRSEIDKARQKARERLARAGCRDEHRMLAALSYRQHLGLMPPDPPAARGKPVGERDGERHGKDVAACEARGKASADRPV